MSPIRKRPPTREAVFRLIETADNFVKYAKPGGEARARERALDRYRSARDIGATMSDSELVRIATLRITDLDAADTAGPVGQVQLVEPAARRSGAGGRVPPGQSLPRDWPVLHEGGVPRFDMSAWRLKVFGSVEDEVELTFDRLRALAPMSTTSDFHCVTGWSKLDMSWEGVWFHDVAMLAGPTAEATHLMGWAPGGYCANVPLDLALVEGFLAWGHGGKPLEPIHGGPLRLVVPSVYAWKSVKWVMGLELMTADRRGYWEVRGYHNQADPFLEERYSYQEERGGGVIAPGW